MHRRVVRVGLVLIMLVVVASTLYQLVLTQQEIDDHHGEERLFIRRAAELVVRLTDLRAAQQSYVATGQDPGYWVEKVSAGMSDVTSALGTLTALARTPDAGEALEEAELLLQRLARIDALAREHTAAEQALMASDLIFTDGLEIATRMARQLDLARVAEEAVYTQRRRQQRQAQTLALTGLVATVLVVTLLLLPIRSTRPADHPRSSPSEEPVNTDRLSTPEPSANAAAPVEPTGRTEPAVAVASPNHDELQRAAALCTDLGRLTSAAELPVLLERAAELLHASGLIVWVRDPSGTGLRPAAAHGYSSETLARLGGVACSSDNAAAAAYRSRQMQVVPVGGTTEKGALVAPILAPDDCVGVMSAELKAGWEGSAEVQATASIFAAQLATLVAADPTENVDTEVEQVQV